MSESNNMNAYFESVLREVVVSSIKKEPVAAKILTPEVIQYYPCKLYKFKSLDEGHREKSFQMIEEQYLWAAHPETFADPTDARIKLRPDEMRSFWRWLEKHYAEFVFYELPPRGVMEGEKCGITLQELIQQQKEFTGRNGNNMLAELKIVLEKADIAESMRKVILDKFRRIIQPDYLQEVRKELFAEYEKLVNSFRKSSLVSCVTTTYRNNLLWENYADNYAGMVIEYTIPPYEQMSDEEKQMILHLFPVKYLKKIPKVSMIPLFEGYLQKEYYKDDVDYGDLFVEIYKQLFFKDSSYAEEREWRFVDCVNSNKIPFPYISRVIAGYKIDPTVLVRLNETCNKMGIELLLQKNDELKSELQYEK